MKTKLKQVYDYQQLLSVDYRTNTQHITEITTTTPADALDYWPQNKHQYSRITITVAQDLLAAPTSEASVERILSVCGLLASGRRNCTSKSLEMRDCFKINSDVLKYTKFMY